MHWTSAPNGDIKNASMAQPARVLGCLIADKGQPLAVPAQ
jgi:hypothetical protein